MAETARRRVMTMLTTRFLADEEQLPHTYPVVVAALDGWDASLAVGSEADPGPAAKFTKTVSTLVSSNKNASAGAGAAVLAGLLRAVARLEVGSADGWAGLLGPHMAGWLQCLSVLSRRTAAGITVRAHAFTALVHLLDIIAVVPGVKSQLVSGSSASGHLSTLMGSVLETRPAPELAELVADVIVSAVNVLGVSLRGFVPQLEEWAMAVFEPGSRANTQPHLQAAALHVLAALPRLVQSEVSWSASLLRTVTWAHALLDAAVGPVASARAAAYAIPDPQAVQENGEALLLPSSSNVLGMGRKKNAAKNPVVFDPSAGFRTQWLAKVDTVMEAQAVAPRFALLVDLICRLLVSRASGAGKGTAATLRVSLPVDVLLGLALRVLDVDVAMLSRAMATHSLSGPAAKMYSGPMASADAALAVPHLVHAAVTLMQAVVRAPVAPALGPRVPAIVGLLRKLLVSRRVSAGPSTGSGAGASVHPAHHTAVYGLVVDTVLRLPFTDSAGGTSSSAFSAALVDAVSADLRLVSVQVASTGAGKLVGGKRRGRRGKGASKATAGLASLNTVSVTTVASDALATAAARAAETYALASRESMSAIVHDALEAACMTPLLDPHAHLSDRLVAALVDAYTALLARPRVLGPPSTAYAIHIYKTLAAASTSTAVLKAVSRGRAALHAILHPRVPILTSRPVLAAAMADVDASATAAAAAASAAASLKRKREAQQDTEAGAGASASGPAAGSAAGVTEHDNEGHPAKRHATNKARWTAQTATKVTDAPVEGTTVSAMEIVAPAPAPPTSSATSTAVSTSTTGAAEASAPFKMPASLASHSAPRASSAAPTLAFGSDDDSDDDMDFGGLVDAPPSDDE